MRLKEDRDRERLIERGKLEESEKWMQRLGESDARSLVSLDGTSLFSPKLHALFYRACSNPRDSAASQMHALPCPNLAILAAFSLTFYFLFSEKRSRNSFYFPVRIDIWKFFEYFTEHKSGSNNLKSDLKCMFGSWERKEREEIEWKRKERKWRVNFFIYLDVLTL